MRVRESVGERKKEQALCLKVEEGENEPGSEKGACGSLNHSAPRVTIGLD